jgi:hypothetical protein
MPSMRTPKLSKPLVNTPPATRGTGFTASDVEKDVTAPDNPEPPRKKRRSDSTPQETPKRRLFGKGKGTKKDTSTQKAPLSSFPNIADPKAVDQAWKLSALQQMLTDVGEDSSGNKADLVKRIIEHARIDDTSKITEAHISKLSDLQVAYALQKHKIELDLDHKRRRIQLREFVQSQAARDSNKAEDLKSLSDIGRLEKRLADMESMLAKFCKQPPPTGDNDDASDKMEISDSDNDIKPDSSSSLSLGSGKRKTPELDDKFSTFASSLATALADGLASFAESTPNNNTAAINAKLERTHPALVDPRRHNNDPHKYGLLIRRMITVDYRDAGITALTWRRSCKQQVALIHGMIHSGTSQSLYNEGEALFISYVNECITLAVEYDYQASKYATLRTKQLGWWYESFNDIKTSLREAGRYMQASNVTFRMQMEDIITTALDVGMSNAQIRNLQTTFKLRSALGSQQGHSDDDDHDMSHSFGGNRGTNPTLFGRASKHDSSTRLEAQQSGFNKSNKKDKKVSFGNAANANDHAGAASRPRTSTGERMPIASAIIGASTHGAVPCDYKCSDCGKGGTADVGHRKFECPKRFAIEHPGRTMPGFDRDGERNPHAWEGNDIIPATKAQWLRMISQGYFTQPPFRNDPDKRPDMRK